MNNSSEITTQQIISEDRDLINLPTPVILLLPAPLRFLIISLRNPDRARPNSEDWYFVHGESDFDKP